MKRWVGWTLTEKTGVLWRWIVDIAPEQSPATPAPEVAVDALVEPDKAGPEAGGLLTKEIAACFADCYYSEKNWPKRMSDMKWLKPACIGLGEAGGASGLWRPLLIAQLVHKRTKGEKAKEQVMKTLNSRFTLYPALLPWRDAFNEYYATYCTTV